jgi:purine-binding chemotaxis protein CheW
MSAQAAAPSALEVIAFTINGQEFCLDIMAVREIRGWSPTTTLPHAPEYVRGVINLRGAVLPIVDFKARLGLGRTETSPRSVIIVVRTGVRIVGLLVDAVSDILTAQQAEVQATPNVGCDTVSRFIKGIIAVDDRMISLVGLESILPEPAETET